MKKKVKASLKKERKIPCTALFFVVGLTFPLIHCVSIHIIVVKIIFLLLHSFDCERFTKCNS